MIALFLFLCLLQDPTPPQQPATPQAAPAGQQKPSPPSSRDDRFEGRVAEEPGTNTAPAAPAAADVPSPPATVDPFEGWLQFNRIALIVNEEAVTLRDIQRGVVRRARDQKRANLNEQRMVEDEITDSARSMLQIQGGKDLGYEKEQVDRIVNSYMERQTELAGGVTLLAESLKREDKDSFARKEEIYAYVNNKLWSESTTGESPGPGGRVMRDRYARPGRALFEHREAVKNLSKTRSVETTQLILQLGSPAAPGAEERVRRRLEELRARVENGEDMGELADLHGDTEKGKRGRTAFLSLAAMRKTNPEIAAYLDKAKVGELSPVLPFLRDGKVVAFAVVRPEEYKSAPIENFDESAGQGRAMLALRERLDKLRTDMGLFKLLGAAYVWPPQSFGGAGSAR